MKCNVEIFRIHIRPKGGSKDMEATFRYCLEQRILGVGWRIPGYREIKDWKEFCSKATNLGYNLDTCNYIYQNIKPGHLVWTRDHSGQYYLARVLSGWEYWQSEEAAGREIDVANIFRCEIKRVEIDEVPGKVVASFRASRTIQRIQDDKARDYTCYLWNILSKKEIYKVDREKYSDDPFMMFDAEETEDVIFLFLQTKGWYVVPNSRKGDTMTFEYLVVDPRDCHIAGVQVKTGNTPINVSAYSNFLHKVFLFQANNDYQDRDNVSEKVTLISLEEVRTFLREANPWLPKSLRRKLEIVGFLSGSERK